MKQLDLSSFDTSVTFAEAKPYLKIPFDRNWFSLLMLVVAVAAFVFILGVPLLSGTFSTTGAILLVIGIAVVGFVVLALYKDAVNKAKLARIAEVNGLIATFDVPYPDYNGLYFQHGTDRKVIEHLDIPNEEISIGSYQYVTGNGKSRQTHKVCFASTTLTRNLPHIVLDNRVNNVWSFTNLPTVFSSDQKLSLEGDFNKTFTLYAPKEYEHDALYIFTPDVMQAFIQSGYNIDAEIIDNKLYIYYDGQTTLADKAFLASIYAIIQTLGEEVEDQTQYYADERVATRTANVVAPAGKRLKSGFGAISTFIIIGYFLIQSFRFESGSLIFTPVAWIYLTIVIGYYVIVIWQGRSSNK